MDSEFKERFLQSWAKYFPGAELPIGFYYSNTAEPKFMAKPPKGHRCIIGDLAKVRDGKTLCFDVNTIGCFGGKRYLGFEMKLAPDFEYFLSYGIPGKLEGERYKISPELVKENMKHQKPSKAPENYIIFKRFDQMRDSDKPLVAIFFAPPDVLSGLFTLANFDEPQPNGVIAPFCAGCASIVDFPLKELKSSEPRAVLGMFDVSARPCVPANVLTFAVPWSKYVRMVNNMKESFLITKSWNKVRARIKKTEK
jgi:Uncharacterised ArCR, COG2043